MTCSAICAPAGLAGISIPAKILARSSVTCSTICCCAVSTGCRTASAMTGSMLAAATSSRLSTFRRLLAFNWLSATNCCSFFSTVSGSVFCTSKLISMSKFSSGLPLSKTCGSGTPVTRKKTSSGPKRWKHL